MGGAKLLGNMGRTLRFSTGPAPPGPGTDHDACPGSSPRRQDSPMGLRLPPLIPLRGDETPEERRRIYENYRAEIMAVKGRTDRLLPLAWAALAIALVLIASRIMMLWGRS